MTILSVTFPAQFGLLERQLVLRQLDEDAFVTQIYLPSRAEYIQGRYFTCEHFARQDWKMRAIAAIEDVARVR